MSKLKIKIYPDPFLRKKAVDVDGVDEETKSLVKDMIEAMYAGDGAGLAGPQVGISKRIFVIDAADGKGPRVFINPKILKKKGREMGSEGCLSLPGLECEVRRAHELKCRFLDKKGKEQEIKAKDILARVIQHENDHLDGKLFIDRVGWLKRRKLLKNYFNKKGGNQSVLGKILKK